MLDPIVSGINFVNGPLLLLLICSNMVSLVLNIFDKDSDERVLSGRYTIERGTLSQLE